MLGRLRGQSIRYPLFLSHGLAFVALQFATTVVVEQADGSVHRWTPAYEVIAAARCGPDIVISAGKQDRMTVERLDADGRFLAALTAGPWDTAPNCSPDGRILYYLRQKDRPGVVRCDPGGCRDIIGRQGMSMAVAPDGKRLALVSTIGRKGPVVEIADTDGGRARDLAEIETGCPPRWASNATLWVERRRGGKLVWTEIDADTARDTGRSVPGSRDCADGKPDPQAPTPDGVRVVYDQRSQVRFLPRERLARATRAPLE
jgi:dipeptidyl aminopeptidase/acylaminoacyl peptidase